MCVCGGGGRRRSARVSFRTQAGPTSQAGTPEWWGRRNHQPPGGAAHRWISALTAGAYMAAVGGCALDWSLWIPREARPRSLPAGRPCLARAPPCRVDFRAKTRTQKTRATEGCVWCTARTWPLATERAVPLPHPQRAADEQRRREGGRARTTRCKRPERTLRTFP